MTPMRIARAALLAGLLLVPTPASALDEPCALFKEIVVRKPKGLALLDGLEAVGAAAHARPSARSILQIQALTAILRAAQHDDSVGIRSGFAAFMATCSPSVTSPADVTDRPPAVTVVPPAAPPPPLPRLPERPTLPAMTADEAKRARDRVLERHGAASAQCVDKQYGTGWVTICN